MSAVHRDVSGHRAVDIYPLVHPAEACFSHQFSLQFGMELDVFI